MPVCVCVNEIFERKTGDAKMKRREDYGSA